MSFTIVLLMLIIFDTFVVRQHFSHTFGIFSINLSIFWYIFFQNVFYINHFIIIRFRISIYIYEVEFLNQFWYFSVQCTYCMYKVFHGLYNFVHYFYFNFCSWEAFFNYFWYFSVLNKVFFGIYIQYVLSISCLVQCFYTIYFNPLYISYFIFNNFGILQYLFLYLNVFIPCF